MMTGIASTFSNIYKSQIKEIFKQHNIADLSAEESFINLLIQQPELIQGVTILRVDHLKYQASQIILKELYIKKEEFWNKIVNANISRRNAQFNAPIG